MASVNENQKIVILNKNTSILSFARDVAKKSDEEKGFIVCDIGEIVERYNEWIQSMPKITPFYAVKCNDDDTVLKTLSAMGAGFDCSSKLEIDKVLDIGVSTDRIIFSHTTKFISYIRHAKTRGVSLMTFDNEQELYKIKKYYPDSKLVLRFRCDDETALCNLGLKYGCDHKTEAPQLFKVARELDLNLVGVAFHVGSGCKTPKIFRTALCYAREVFDLAKTFNYDLHLLDIGGGYLTPNIYPIDVFGKIINAGLEEYFKDLNVEIISEPGAYLVSTSGTVATNIHSFRTVKQHDDSGNISLHNMYYINDGYYGSFNMHVTHGTIYTVKLLYEKDADATLIESSIWGPTCDSKDKICVKMLPQMNIGDWLLFDDLGDYTFKAPSEFNGFPRPDIHFVVKESMWKLLQKKLPFTPEDFTAETKV